jgi:hypothetical protein
MLEEEVNAMAAGVRHIAIDEQSELGKALRDARAIGERVVLEVDGHAYDLALRSSDGDDEWEGYDPEKVREALDQTAGSWADLNADRLIADIYRAREEGSRPADRP